MDFWLDLFNIINWKPIFFYIVTYKIMMNTKNNLYY